MDNDIEFDLPKEYQILNEIGMFLDDIILNEIVTPLDDLILSEIVAYLQELASKLALLLSVLRIMGNLIAKRLKCDYVWLMVKLLICFVIFSQ